MIQVNIYFMDWKDRNKFRLEGILERFGQAMTQTAGRRGSLPELGLEWWGTRRKPQVNTVVFT